MTAAFVLPATLEASEPAEVRGAGRDDVRLLVGRRRTNDVQHRHFRDLPSLLRRGDVLVVNTSATIPAAVDAVFDDRTNVVVHFSTELPDGTWTLELRSPQPGGATTPFRAGRVGAQLTFPGHASAVLLAPHTPDRLWTARLRLPHSGGLLPYLRRHGRPIRYGYVGADWPIATYQTVFAGRPGSAEMPSAGRPFTAAMVRRLRSVGVAVVPVLLHAGVASPEVHEKPSLERYEVSPATAGAVRRARAAGGRVIAVGTTAVRAVESSTDADGCIQPSSGWTDLVITPERGVFVVDGLLTGFHEPHASHLLMLEAIAGSALLERCYDAALRGRYLFHEFGDVNLLLP